MSEHKRFVVDTNLLVSRLLLPESLPATAVQHAIEQGDLLVSEASLEELASVLARPKFDRYLSQQERQQFFRLLSRLAICIEIIRPIQVCRDPKDDKFLEIAVNGRADALLSGDADLLALHPYAGIPILSPREFLES